MEDQAQSTTTHPEKVRKTISFTHKQLGVTGGLVGALTLIAQMKGSFFTREEGTGLEKNQSRIEKIIQNNKEENQQNLEAIKTDFAALVRTESDRIITEIGKIEERSVKVNDRQDKKIDDLDEEFKYVLLNKPKKVY